MWGMRNEAPRAGLEGWEFHPCGDGQEGLGRVHPPVLAGEWGAQRGAEVEKRLLKELLQFQQNSHL